MQRWLNELRDLLWRRWVGDVVDMLAFRTVYTTSKYRRQKRYAEGTDLGKKGFG